MSNDEWKEVRDFQKRADEALELFNRSAAAFPVKREVASLRARHDAADPNVIKIYHGEKDEDGVEYRLEFTDDQKTELHRVYLAARPRGDGVTPYPDENERAEFDASVFVGTIERWAGAIGEFQSTIPATQKERKRSMESASNAIMKFDQALDALDSAALGYMYAHIVDALAPRGVQLSPADNQITSMVDHPVRAMVEAGEFRARLRGIIEAVVEATKSASDTLPKHEHTENDPRYQAAANLEKVMVRTGLPFNSSETGPAATFLRAIFELGGIDIEKVSYWLKKVEDDPDNEAAFLKRMRDGQ